jgi:heavy metal sensor kinase
MSRLSIRWQFTLWFGATLAAVLVAFSLLLSLIMRHQLLASLDGELAEELREITVEIGLTKTVPALLEHLQRSFADHGEFHFEVRQLTGKVIFQSRALQGQPTLDVTMSGAGVQFENSRLPGLGPSRVAFAMVNGPGGPYVAGAVTSLDVFERQMSLLTKVVVASVPLALGLALSGGYLLARRALSPVDRMVEMANRITVTDLHQRVEVVNSRDELGRLAQTINSLIDRLQKAIEEMRRFTADAAHELRTPLAVLRSGIEVTLRIPRSADEYRRALEAAADESHRLARLADQLLLLSRQEAGMTQLEQEEVRLDALIKDVVERFEAAAQEAGVTFAIEPLEPCTVRGDDIRLSQVIFNALQNAIKYTPPGGRVTVRCRPAGARVRIEVEDTGTGIVLEDLAHVFKRFYRAERQPTTGAGLGLAIARSAVLAHNGQIWLESQSGRGTLLCVELPLIKSAVNANQSDLGRDGSDAEQLDPGPLLPVEDPDAK